MERQERAQALLAAWDELAREIEGEQETEFDGTTTEDVKEDSDAQD